MAFVADGELGMPLDLGNANNRIAYLSGSRDSVTFDENKPVDLDPEDEELCKPLGDASSSAAAKKIAVGGSAGRPSGRSSTSHVAWLRRPEMDAAPGRASGQDR